MNILFVFAHAGEAHSVAEPTVQQTSSNMVMPIAGITLVLLLCGFLLINKKLTKHNEVSKQKKAQ